MDDLFVRSCRRAAAWFPAKDAPSRVSGRGLLAARSAPMQRAIDFLGLPVSPDEVRAFAVVVSIASGIGVTAIALAASLATAGGVLPVSPPVLAGPSLAAAAAPGHPEARARRGRLASLAEAPEAVSYLAMSLRVRPSLDRAIAFAARHTGGALGRHLRGVLWDVHLRTRTRIEDIFLRFADDWGTWNGELKSALYAIAHAVHEGPRDGMSPALDRARAMVFEGTRRRWQDYAAGLRGPTTALFALGVLLPLIVGSMVPLLSLGGVAPSSFETQPPPPGDPLPWILLLDVGFPALTFLFAFRVSGRRPGLAARRDAIRWRPLVVFAMIPAPAFVLLAWACPDLMPPLLAVGGLAGGACLALYLATRDGMKERKRTSEVEREFPDALFQLGSRLREGRGLEDAFLAVAGGFRGAAAGELFARIANALRLGGGTIEDGLFGPRGALRGVRSRSVRASLRMAVDIAAKDPASAGESVIEMSGHLRDLEAVERDLHAEIRPTVDAMRATAAFFAPLVLGVTAGLYGLLSRAFASFASLPMSLALFQAALGLHLLFGTAAIQYFATRVDGGDTTAFAASLARILPVGYVLFAATAFLSS